MGCEKPELNTSLVACCCQLENNAMRQKINETGVAQSHMSTVRLEGELMSQKESVVRLEGENATLQAQVLQLQQHLTTTNTNSEFDMDEVTVRNRRLQSENARFQASFESATSREEKLKQAHRSTHELNIKLMDDITALNNRGIDYSCKSTHCEKMGK